MQSARQRFPRGGRWHRARRAGGSGVHRVGAGGKAGRHGGPPVPGGLHGLARPHAESVVYPVAEILAGADPAEARVDVQGGGLSIRAAMAGIRCLQQAAHGRGIAAFRQLPQHVIDIVVAHADCLPAPGRLRERLKSEERRSILHRREDEDCSQHPLDGAGRNEFLAAGPQVHAGPRPLNQRAAPGASPGPRTWPGRGGRWPGRRPPRPRR
jgi:hypothetical protein